MQQLSFTIQTAIQPNSESFFIIPPGTYSIDQTFFSFAIEYISLGGVLPASVYNIGESRYFGTLLKMVVNWDGQCRYNSQKPYLTQKKYYDKFVSQKQYPQFYGLGDAEQIVQNVPQYQDVIATNNGIITNNYGQDIYMTYPIRQFIPFLFGENQKTFTVNQSMQIQLSFNNLLLVEIASQQYEEPDLNELRCQVKQGREHKIKTISVDDQFEKQQIHSYYQYIYGQQNVQQTINIQPGFFSQYQIMGKMVDYQGSAATTSFQAPDAVSIDEPLNYTKTLSINNHQLIIGESVMDASNQFKNLQKDQIVNYVTGCVLLENLLPPGGYIISIQQSEKPLQEENLVVGWQVIKE